MWRPCPRGQEPALSEHQQVAEAADAVRGSLDLIVQRRPATRQSRCRSRSIVDRRGGLVDGIPRAGPARSHRVCHRFEHRDVGGERVVARWNCERLSHDRPVRTCSAARLARRRPSSRVVQRRPPRHKRSGRGQRSNEFPRPLAIRPRTSDQPQTRTAKCRRMARRPPFDRFSTLSPVIHTGDGLLQRARPRC